ncbi:MAG: hypothetical protein ACSHXW_04230 [Yoonia sp.]
MARFGSPSTIPTSGKAQYDGVVLLKLTDTTDQGFDAAAGQVNIDVAFDSSAIDGSTYNFVDGSGDTMAGQLTISSGTIDRMISVLDVV